MTDYPPGDNPRLPEIVAKINPAFGQFLSYGKGWDNIVRDLDDDLEGLLSNWEDGGGTDPGKLVYLQIKEKFGALRVYIDTTDWPAALSNAALRLIDVSERTSARICEACGKPGGSVTIRGWMHTLCADDAEALEERGAAAFRQV